MNWKDIYPNLVLCLHTINRMHCCPTLVDEVKELLSLMNSHNLGYTDYISPYDIESVNLDVTLQRSFKDKHTLDTKTITGVIDDPREMHNLLYDIIRFFDWDDCYYCVTGTIALVADHYLYHVHFEQECGATLYKIPV